MTRPRTRFALPLCLTATLLSACAGAPPLSDADPIIIPETAVAVDKVTMFNTSEFSDLNRRMMVLWSGRDPYLLVFNTPCYGLNNPTPFVLKTTGPTIYARFDSITPRDGGPCQIDAIYAVQREDVTALKAELKAKD